jgi:cytochrome c biogenesis protein CcdA
VNTGSQRDTCTQVNALGNDQAKPIGVRLSAGFVIALACLFALYTVFYGVMFAAVLLRHGHASDEQQRTLLASTVYAIAGTAVFSCLGFKAASALLRLRKWAAYVAMAEGLLLLVFGGRIIIDLFRPYQPGAVQGEDLFGILVAIPCLMLGLWWCIYLNLPHVRRYFGS